MILSWLTLTVLSMIAISSMEAADKVHVPILRWDYSEEKGPKTWSKSFATCLGERQSPIDIDTHTVMTMAGQPPIEIVHGNSKVHNASIVNTGPLLVINLPDLTLSPKIQGGGLSDIYKLAKITFNWGENNKVGSEHTVDGKFSPLEMKMMFVRDEHDTKEKVLADNKGIAMFSIMWDVMTHNDELDKIIGKFDKVMFQGQKSIIPEFDIQKFLPDLTSFYRYEGSLPVPPCVQNVLWTIPTKKMYLSAEQLGAFRGIYSTAEADSNMKKMQNNNREIQPLNKRAVYQYSTKEIKASP